MNLVSHILPLVLVAVASCQLVEPKTPTKAPSNPAEDPSASAANLPPSNLDLTSVKWDGIGADLAHNAEIFVERVGPTSVEISPKISGAQQWESDLVWDLYFSHFTRSLADLQLIKGDLATTTTSIVWDVSGLEAGSYHLVAIFRARGRTDMVGPAYFGKVPVAVGALPGSVASPALTLVSSFDNRMFLNGKEYTAAFTATDADSDISNQVSFAIEVRKGADGPWEAVAGPVRLADGNPSLTYNAQTSQFAMRFRLSEDQGIDYRFRIVGVDERGAQGTAMGTLDSGISGEMVTFYQHLRPVILNQCANCHTESANNRNDRFQYYDRPAVATTNAAGARILRQVAAITENQYPDRIIDRIRPNNPRRMPQLPRPALDASVARLFKLWSMPEFVTANNSNIVRMAGAARPCDVRRGMSLPNGTAGQTYTKGETIRVQWTCDTSAAVTDLKYLVTLSNTGNNQEQRVVAENLTENSADIQIPADFTVGADNKLVIRAYGVSDARTSQVGDANQPATNLAIIIDYAAPVAPTTTTEAPVQ
jgi:hypothetical protein